MATFRKYIYNLKRLISNQEYNKTSFQSLFLKCKDPQISWFLSNRVFRRSREFKIGYLDRKQLFISNQVFRRCGELKIGYFSWKTAVYIKSGFQEVESLKSAILDRKQFFCIKSGVWEVEIAHNRLF